MANELAFVLINPYTIAKSRTGGVIARVISRADLNLVGARMFGPSAELAATYAASLRDSAPEHVRVCRLLSDYIRREYSPDPKTGRPRRVMLLLFEGESAVRKIWGVTGSATGRKVSGSTIRDTYGDYIADSSGDVKYFEPAVFVARNIERAATTLRLWAEYSDSDGGIIDHAGDVPDGRNVEKTLVMLKPDNFRFPSLRPGSIIDVLSSSGLRIVAIRKFSMSVAQAEEFYGPVERVLEKKFADIGAGRAARVLSEEFGFSVPESATRSLCKKLGGLFAHHQFQSIVQFMTGHRPSDCPEPLKSETGSEECLALLYEGVNAVKKIRNILGPTDPTKAAPGSVRREFGTDIMINAAHASDSARNALREMKIVNMGSESIKALIDKYYGNN